MSSLEALVQEIVAKRAKLGAAKDSEAGAPELLEVWATVVRYLQSCMEQKRGLAINNFCRIGWQIEKRRSGFKAIYRPYAQFTEQFCRAYVSPEAARKHVTTPATNELSPFEEFNFSKAAIKFSNSLTKDQVFSGLRSLVLRIGEAVSEGKEVDLTLGEVGRFICKGDKDPRILFAAELYTREGLEAPVTALEEGSCVARAVPSFRRDAPQDVQQLGIRGNVAPQELPPEPVTVPHLGLEYQSTLPISEADPQRQLYSSGSAPSLGTPSRVPGMNGTQFKKEVAFKEALDRHISSMEARAAEAMAEREAWSSHVSACLDQERDELQQRRMRAQMNLHFVKHQIAMGEERRKEQRKEDIEAASSHDFPKFQDVPESERKEFNHGQQARVRNELDEQVRTNNTLRNLQKQRERALEVNQLEANRREMGMLRNAERAKKAFDREALTTSWNSEIRMKNIWKAIESHTKVGAQSQVMLMDDLPPSRGGSAVSAGRLLTGSSRRVPLGASSSLTQLETRVGSVRPVM